MFVLRKQLAQAMSASSNKAGQHVAFVAGVQRSGTNMMMDVLERSEQTGAALYTETTLERAANLYERHGFKAINRTALPVLDLPLWEFVREPSAR